MKESHSKLVDLVFKRKTFGAQAKAYLLHSPLGSPSPPTFSFVKKLPKACMLNVCTKKFVNT